MSESNRRRLFELLKIPGNNICADCDQEGIHYFDHTINPVHH
jgi:hypothetical protein